MSQVTLKLQEDTLKAIGATAADADEKILALVQANTKAKEDLKTAETASSDFTVKITAIEDRLKAVEARKLEVSAEDRQTILAAATAEAKKAASAEVSAAIAKVGVNALRAGNGDDQKEDKITFEDAVQAKMAAGLKQGDAVSAAIKEYPKEHAAWKAKGGSLSLEGGK